jgi:hypothetical protein
VGHAINHEIARPEILDPSRIERHETPAAPLDEPRQHFF